MSSLSSLSFRSQDFPRPGPVGACKATHCRGHLSYRLGGCWGAAVLPGLPQFMLQHKRVVGWPQLWVKDGERYSIVPGLFNCFC